MSPKDRIKAICLMRQLEHQEDLQKKYPQCEFNAVSGGQPVYYYILSIE